MNQHGVGVAARVSACWALAWALAWAFAGPAAATEAAPPAPGPAASPAGELVFDFRPRIRTASGGPAPRDVHLHLARHQLPPRARGSRPGCARTPVEPGRVALVLSGGVSKGLAFVGALQALDDLGLRVDKVAGTSMGAVVGAFYAAGYPPDHLYAGLRASSLQPAGPSPDILARIDWRTMFTDVPQVRSLTANQLVSWGLDEGQQSLPRTYQLGLRSGQNLSTELSKYLLAASAASEGCFDDLYVPFVASATSVTGSETRRLRSGELSLAVRASLSYPLMFTPTHIDGERFIDGGILDNFPVRAFQEEAAEGVPPYAVILGFDVSDTQVARLPAPSVVQATSLAEAYSAIEAGIGAAISRETARSARLEAPCTFSAGPSADGKPCLFRVKFVREGGFTDFGPAQVADFVHSGRAMVLWKLCEAFAALPGPGDCAQGLSGLAEGGESWSGWSEGRRQLHRDRIEELTRVLRAHIRGGPWRHLMHDAAATLATARRGEHEAPIEQFRRSADGLVQALGHVLEGGEPASRIAGWETTLEGLEAVWQDGRLSLRLAPTVAQDARLRGVLLRAALAQVGWLEARLRPGPQANGATVPVLDANEVSRVSIGIDGSRVRVRVTSWNYHVRGLVRQRGLTEELGLDGARLDYWGLGRAERQQHLEHVSSCHGRNPTPAGQARQCRPDAAGQPARAARPDDGAPTWNVALGHLEAPEPPSPAGPWWNHIWRRLGGKTFDVRHGRTAAGVCEQGACAQESLSEALEVLLERYYAVAAVEHIRLEGIAPGRLEIGEKPTHRAGAGGLFFGYQYDYRNKHSWGLQYVLEGPHASRWWPTRVVLGLVANEPASEPRGLLLADAKLLFLPSLEPDVPDYSLSPHLARRVHRIGGGPQRLEWAERGLAGTVSGRMPASSMAAGRLGDIALSWALTARWRRLDEARSEQLDTWRERLRDPALGSARQEVASLVALLRAVQFQGEATLAYPVGVALHHTRGASFHEVFGDIRVELPWRGRDAQRLVSLRTHMSRVKPFRNGGVPVPHDELYSAGGHYPLASRETWGRKRFDYLGADLNALWGSRVYGWEARASLWRVAGLRYFAPQARLQLDAVLQGLKIGFPQDPERRWRHAIGLVGSAYAPSLGTFRPRLSLAVGREDGGSLRVFTAVDLVI